MADSYLHSESGMLAPRDAFAELGKITLDAQPLSLVLERVAGLAKRTVPDLTDVSVTLLDRGKARTAAFTGRLAIDLDERQYEAGFGPCTDAAMSGQTIVVASDDPTSPYQDFSAACARAGIAHVVSVGLPTDERVVGALNLYADSVEPINTGSVEIAEAFAGYAAVAVSNAGLYQTTVDLVAHLQAAMASRGIIEQAKGVLIERHGCTDDEAFAVLARTSQNTHRKLREVAANLVAGAQAARN